MALLNVEGIRKSFGSNEVLKGIDFELEKGEVLAIIGSSGSGKTTLLRTLNFLESADEGKITVNGEVLFDSEEKQGNGSRKASAKSLRERRLHFGLVFQSFNLFPHYNIITNVRLAAELLTAEKLRSEKKRIAENMKREIANAKKAYRENIALLRAKKLGKEEFGRAKQEEKCRLYDLVENVIPSKAEAEMQETKNKLLYSSAPAREIATDVSAADKSSADPKRGKKLFESEIRRVTEARAQRLLDRVGLGDRANAYPCELSGGQCQRVAIARALALEPDILCFDEPTSALDPELTGEVLKVIKGLKSSDRTMIVVTHEMEFARGVADKVIFMADGIIEEEGTPEQVFGNPRSEKTIAFLRKSAEAV